MLLFAVMSTTVPTAGDAALPPNVGLLLFFALAGLFAGAVRTAERVTTRSGVRDVLVGGAGGALTGAGVGSLCLGYWGLERFYLSLCLSSLGGWIGTSLYGQAALIFEAWARAKLPAAIPPPPPPQPVAAATPPAAASEARP